MLTVLESPGTPRLTEPRQGNEALGETRLYALAQVEELQPRVSISCAGAGFKHLYVGN